MPAEIRLEIDDRQSAVIHLYDNQAPELILYTVLPEWGAISHKLKGANTIKRFSDWLAKEVKAVPALNLPNIEEQAKN